MGILWVYYNMLWVNIGYIQYRGYIGVTLALWKKKMETT